MAALTRAAMIMDIVARPCSLKIACENDSLCHLPVGDTMIAAHASSPRKSCGLMLRPPFVEDSYRM
jgi:hypothetical protein